MAVCPYCRELIGERELHACPVCHTPHHAACWQENRGCTVFGCQCAPGDEPKVSITSSTVAGSRYLLARHGEQFGPYAIEELRQFVAQRRATEADLVWSEGMPQWLPLGQVLGSNRSMVPPRSAAPPPSIPSAHVPAAYGAAQPTYPGGHAQGMAKPESYLLSAILVTLFCCVPFGVVSIVYASQVDTKFRAGDYAGAQSASSSARAWCLASLLTGLAVGVLVILINVGVALQ